MSLDLEPYRARLRRVLRLEAESPLPPALERKLLDLERAQGGGSRSAADAHTIVAQTATGAAWWTDTPRGADILAGVDHSILHQREGEYRNGAAGDPDRKSTRLNSSHSSVSRMPSSA